jgi:hypothetical protein
MAQAKSNKSTYEHPLKGSTSILFKKTPAKTSVKASVKKSTNTKTDSSKPSVAKKILDKANEYPSKPSVKKATVKAAPIKEKSWDDYRKGQTPADAPRVKKSTKAVKGSSKSETYKGKGAITTTTDKGRTTKFTSGDAKGSTMYTNSKGITHKGPNSISYTSEKTGDTTIKVKDKTGKAFTSVMTKDGKYYRNPPVTKSSQPKSSTPAAKTVSQIWKEKTGKDWSEAKSLGLSDGSAASNMALLKKLKSGSLTNSDLSSSKFKDVGTLATKKLDTPKAELETKRKGGSVTKMQAGGVVDKIRSGMRNISRKINAPIKKTFKASAQKYQTGGMVNSNAKVAASRVASGRPVKSAELKSAAKKATGRVGGISKSPRAAAPKMKMGGSMKRK